VNLELYIANRILSGKSENKSISRPIVRIAIIGIAIGLSVMILSIAIVIGFKKEITEKVTGFGADFQITHFDNNTSFETTPLTLNDSIKNELKEIKGVKYAQFFATKPSILKTKTEIQGVVLHGTDTDFNTSFLKRNIVKGKFYEQNDSTKSNQCLISLNISKMLNIKIGDKITFWFIQKPVRARRFTVSGIYNTGLQEFDNLFVYCDIRHIQKLNNWSSNQYSGIEVKLNDIKQIDDIYPEIRRNTSIHSGEKQMLKTINIKSKYPNIFNWLDLIDMNVWIIISLMIIVAGFNMVSGLLILILEKTNMIGILKALGQKDINIRKIFLYMSARLVGQGLLLGNIIGISICLLQKYGRIIPLDPVMYYINTVPININLFHILLLNVGTLLITVMMLVIPSMIISKVSPIKAIKFD